MSSDFKTRRRSSSWTSQAIVQDKLQSFQTLKNLIQSVNGQKMTETHLGSTEMWALNEIIKSGFSPESVIDELANLAGKFTCKLVRSGDNFVLYDPSGKEEDKSNKEKPKKKPVSSYADRVSEQQKLSAGIKSLLEETYRSLIQDQKLSEQELFALAETLSRVPQEKWNAEKSNLLSARTPSRLYEWAIANSSVVLPYLSLKVAGENMKDSNRFAPGMTWGLIDGIFHLPKEESCSDSNLWTLISDILIATFGDKAVKRDALMDSSVPSLDSDVVAKNTVINPILVRILELFKSPGSATIRSTDSTENDRSIRNAVDFYVLDRYRSRHHDLYEYMVYTPLITNYRRLVTTTVTKQTSKGPVIETRPRHIGYALSTLLIKYVETPNTKGTPENEPFVRFIFSILDKVVERIEAIGAYYLPKSLFVDPASTLKTKIRRGPDISRKGKAAKSNLYIPFSFTKSSECERMRETIRKDLTSIGSDILNNINSINHLSIHDQNNYFWFYEQYISICYSISDEIRKRWRLEARVIDTKPIKLALVDNFPIETPVSDEGISFDEEDYINRCRKVKLIFSPASTDEQEIKAIKESISTVINARKQKRGNPRS